MVLHMAENKIPKITINGKKENNDFNATMLNVDKKISILASILETDKSDIMIEMLDKSASEMLKKNKDKIDSLL